MNALAPYLGMLKAVAVIAAVLGLFASGVKVGGDRIQAKWDAAEKSRIAADNAALLSRIRNNERIAEQQELDRQRITKAHHDELAKVRADIARSHASGLRVGAAICDGFTRAAEAESASDSHGTNPGGGLVRHDVGRDIAALKLRVEEALAAGRACQAFITAEGMAP